MNEVTAVPTRYALGRHVFLCVCGRDVVLLDLARDKYLALEVPHTAGLSALVRGWPAAPVTQSAEESDAIARALLARGLLTPDLALGKDATPIQVASPAEEINADACNARANMMELGAATLACLTTRFLWPRLSIEQKVDRARARRRQIDFDMERAKRLIMAFDAVRSLFFSTHSACLRESFALLELFARYRLHPQWVFGVQVRPFRAHCWLQHKDVVLNDTADRVSQYTPIMTV